MNLLSLTAYAATHGAARQAAAGWKRKGAIVFSGELVDVEASDAHMRNLGLGRFRTKGHGGRRRAGVRGVMDRPGLTPPAESEADAAEAARHRAFRKVSPESFSAHMLAEVDALATEARQGVRIDFGALREMAATATWSDIEDEQEVLGWLAWPARVAEAIAAELGIPKRAEKVQEAVARHVLHRLTAELCREPDRSREVLAAINPEGASPI